MHCFDALNPILWLPIYAPLPFVGALLIGLSRLLPGVVLFEMKGKKKIHGTPCE